MNNNGRCVAVAGATGLVGFELVKLLCADASVKQVHVLVRRPLAFQHEKLQQHLVDFNQLGSLPAIQEVYLAIGTTIKIAGSKSAFKAADYTANLRVAEAAIKAGAKKVGLVSAMGANAKSPSFYSRTKGELEDSLQALAFDGLVFARPALLRGDREGLGQPVRKGEVLATKIDAFLRPILPKAIKAIDASQVAKALVQAVPEANGLLVLSSKQMQEI